MLWSRKGKLDYAYLLPKNKDLTRDRPIVSYTHHPLKRLFNIAARALAFIVKRARIKHFSRCGKQVN